MKKVALILTDGFEEMEAIGTFAILSRAGLQTDIYSFKGVSAQGRFGLMCTHLKPFDTFVPDNYEALVLPGGPQYAELEKNEKLQQYVHQFLSENKIVAAICASPTILGRAGLLKGKNYTCFTSMDENFGGHFTDEYTTTDGNLITGQSAAATIHFAFAIVEKLLGTEKATQVKNSIYYKS